MSPEKPPRELYLEPGNVAFGDESVQIRTLLGSCVAITFWHRERRIGAMCHFLLPRNPRPGLKPKDARYGEDAIAIILEAFRKRGLRPQSFEVQMFGGADMFSGAGPDIGGRNAHEGRRILEEIGYRVHHQDLAGDCPRVVGFDLRTGRVSVALSGRGPK